MNQLAEEEKKELQCDVWFEDSTFLPQWKQQPRDIKTPSVVCLLRSYEQQAQTSRESYCINLTCASPIWVSESSEMKASCLFKPVKMLRLGKNKRKITEGAFQTTKCACVSKDHFQGHFYLKKLQLACDSILFIWTVQITGRAVEFVCSNTQ